MQNLQALFQGAPKEFAILNFLLSSCYTRERVYVKSAPNFCCFEYYFVQ